MDENGQVTISFWARLASDFEALKERQEEQGENIEGISQEIEMIRDVVKYSPDDRL